MAALAQKLCEAVENEDAKEVENLLSCGADPNLVLPDGIAAIHLASGKESESALRCLTMILQQGGDPNVRSIEELTPVHVAASWGCCKALIFLLRKGGDPNIQDQDGNTALDLALMEKNRRCVVALQEYNERNEDICPDQIHDYYRNDSCGPDELHEISSITLLLESAYEVSPCSSTKISPFISAPKNGTTEKGADDAVLQSQMELLGLDSKVKSEKYVQKSAGLKSSEFHLSDKMSNSTSNLSTINQESKCASLTIQNSHWKNDYSNRLYPDITVGNRSTKIFESSNAHIDVNFEESNTSRDQAKDILFPKLNSSSRSSLEVNRIGKTYANPLMNHSGKLRDSVVILQGRDGLDVTSPDHVYTFSRSHDDHDMEETLVFPRPDEVTEDEAGQEISSSSTYTSCFSNGFATLMENSAASENAGLFSDVNCRSFLDSNSNQLCSENSGTVGKIPKSNVCSALNVESPVPGDGKTLQERVQSRNKEESTSARAHLVFSSQNIGTDGHESETARTIEILCTSQSPTLHASDTNAPESCSQDLKTLLRNLLLSAKGQQEGKLSGPRGESLCSSTIPVINETNPTISQNMKDLGTTCLDTSVDTLIAASPECDPKGVLDSELSDLKKMMLSTKVIHPVSSILSEEKSPCFFTDRSRSRILSSESRHRNFSLFDDSLEMPQRGRRLRSPDGKSCSPVPSIEDRKSFNHTGFGQSESNLDNCVIQNNIHLGQTPKDLEESVSELETTVSNFLTDDLSSSETKVKSIPQVKELSGDPSIDSRVSESVWLTEDADTESSGEAHHKSAVLDSNTLGGLLPAASQTGSFLFSTLTEATAGNPMKVPRYSFSRLSCVPKADDTGIQLTSIPDAFVEELQLSPGGRPMNVTSFEPVEYLYMDNERGHALVERHIPCTDQSSSKISDTSDDTIIYDWRDYSCKEKKKKGSPASTPNRVAVELYRLSNDEIARRLRDLGEDYGQVNSKTRKVCILLLDKCLKEQATSGSVGLSFEYSPELSLALRTYNIPDCHNDEAALSREFDQPDKTKKWREGVLKSSFNYLLLDPRVTRNLPSRCHTLSLPECFRTFVRAVFYVGKGKRARPYCHLYESLANYKGSNKQACSKVQHIVDIWRSGQGVLSLHCFQNTIPVEAYTREACMVDAIGLKMLSNQKKGVYYGQTQNWTLARRRRLGVHMLHRAMQIFLAEGERQLRPPDIRTGS